MVNSYHNIGSYYHLYIVNGRAIHSIRQMSHIIGNNPWGVAKISYCSISNILPMTTEGNSLSVSVITGISPLVAKEWE